MLSSIRKFSTSIYAKILLVIIIIPFVFWGMGSSFIGGNKNVVVVIDDEKYSVEEFANFISGLSGPNQKIGPEQIETYLSIFIGEKLLEHEVRNFKINLSDKALGSLIKNQKNFMRENKFSRTEYEKFLLVNNITANIYEDRLSKQEKKVQLINLIGGGISPPEFIVNLSFDRINQKRKIELINLNDAFKNKMIFSKEEIESYFDNNKNKFSETHRTVMLLELNPEKLSDSDEFNDLFFERIDGIDDMIVQGKNFNEITREYNLDKDAMFTFNTSGNEIENKNIENLPEGVINIILNLSQEDPTILVEKESKFFLLELTKIDEIQKNPEDKVVVKNITKNLENIKKRKLIGELLSKINNNNYSKNDFDKLSQIENVKIQNIDLKNINDKQILREELVAQIYRYSEKKVALVHDLSFSENFLIYVNKIENVTIDKDSEEYSKYSDLTKAKIKNELFNTYDSLVKKKYKIDINYQTLETVKNYFN